VIAIEHGYYLFMTGDLLFRPHAMRIHEQHPDVLETNRHLAYRLLQSYPRMMLVPNSDFGLHSVLGLATTALAVAMLGVSRLRLVLLWAALPWLYTNFGSSNLREYIAIPAAARYIEFFYPPLFVACGGLAGSLRMPRVRWACTAGALVVMLCATGIACAIAGAGRPRYYTQVTAALRPIVRTARAANVISVHFEENVSSRHRQTLSILAPELMVCDERRAAQLVIGVDAGDLPVIVMGPRDQQAAAR
jgi:hypothetical protein